MGSYLLLWMGTCAFFLNPLKSKSRSFSFFCSSRNGIPIPEQLEQNSQTLSKYVFLVEGRLS